MAITKVLKEWMPPALVRLAKQAKKRFGKSNAIEKTFFCPVCNHSVKEFHRISDFWDDMMDKYACIHSIYCIETLNRKAYSCPHCHASDRDRLYAIYLDVIFNAIQTKDRKCNLLEMAPTKCLTEFIKKHRFIQYRSSDLYMEDVDDHVDITDMYIYPDNKFDVIICSHILEHVEDDRKAMSELYRILSPDGFAIVMAPVNLSLAEDFENSTYQTEAERWKYFGQNDHVRFYSKNGFVNKLTQTGFKVSQLGVEYFGQEIFIKNGIHPRSVLYVVTK